MAKCIARFRNSEKIVNAVFVDIESAVRRIWTSRQNQLLWPRGFVMKSQQIWSEILTGRCARPAQRHFEINGFGAWWLKFPA